MPAQTKTAATATETTTAGTPAKAAKPTISPERAALAKKVVRLRKTKTWTAIGAELNLTGSQLRHLFIAGGGVSTGERRVPKAKPSAPKATAAGTEAKTKATSNDEKS